MPRGSIVVGARPPIRRPGAHPRARRSGGRTDDVTLTDFHLNESGAPAHLGLNVPLRIAPRRARLRHSAGRPRPRGLSVSRPARLARADRQRRIPCWSAAKATKSYSSARCATVPAPRQLCVSRCRERKWRRSAPLPGSRARWRPRIIAACPCSRRCSRSRIRRGAWWPRWTPRRCWRRSGRDRN